MALESRSSILVLEYTISQYPNIQWENGAHLKCDSRKRRTLQILKRSKEKLDKFGCGTLLLLLLILRAEPPPRTLGGPDRKEKGSWIEKASKVQGGGGLLVCGSALPCSQ
jgi:hypothetical protein